MIQMVRVVPDVQNVSAV